MGLKWSIKGQFCFVQHLGKVEIKKLNFFKPENQGFYFKMHMLMLYMMFEKLSFHLARHPSSKTPVDVLPWTCRSEGR